MSRVSTLAFVLLAAVGSPIAAQAPTAPQQPAALAGRWPEARAAEWHRAQPWLVGANYTPANAINQIEMWQADTFDPARIDRELGWAAAIGMNTMRVFLHDLAYQQDPAGFLRRLDQFLGIAQKHRIRPMLVLFDSVWDPFFRGDGELNGSETVITSAVSKAFPIADAGFGAVAYGLDVLTGAIGDRRRWRTMPWLVLIFGLLIIPLGLVSIVFIMIQPTIIGAWPDRMPTSPATPRATTVEASPDQSSRSGVTTWTSRGMR